MQFWLSFKMPGLLELHYTKLFSILNEILGPQKAFYSLFWIFEEM